MFLICLDLYTHVRVQCDNVRKGGRDSAARPAAVGVRGCAGVGSAMRRRWRPHSNFNTMRASSCPPAVCDRSTGPRPRSCGSPSVGRRFGRMPCRRSCRHTRFVGRPIIWRPWDCGGRLVLKEFGDLCRQRHAMPACRAATAFRIFPNDSLDSM